MGIAPKGDGARGAADVAPLRKKEPHRMPTYRTRTRSPKLLQDLRMRHGQDVTMERIRRNAQTVGSNGIERQTLD